MKVSERRLKDLDEMIEEGFTQLVSDHEWEILGADELDMDGLAQKKHKDWMEKNDMAHNKNMKKEKPKKKKKKKVSTNNTVD